MDRNRSLSRSLWQAFRRYALLPMIMVELALITIYVVTNQWVTQQTKQELVETALSESTQIAKRQATVVDAQLISVEKQLALYREAIAAVLDDPRITWQGHEQWTQGASGQFFTREALGEDGIAAFYSALTPSPQQNLDRIEQLRMLTPVMRQMVADDSWIQQVYFNTHDSLNVIYPFFDVGSQYAADVDIPKFNFFYLADEQHNPARNPVWTPVYLDPAGQGWMLSVIAPVYKNDSLVGVAGADVTIDKLVNYLTHTQVPWDGFVLLASQSGEILALPERAQQRLDINVPPNDSIKHAKRDETDYQSTNLTEIDGAEELLSLWQSNPDSLQTIALGGMSYIAAWHPVAETDWQVLVLVEEEKLLARTNNIYQQTELLSLILLAGLVIFYLLYFQFVKSRTQRFSQRLNRNLKKLSNALAKTGRQEFELTVPDLEAPELNRLALQITQVAEQLRSNLFSLRKNEARLRFALESSGESLITQSMEYNRVEVTDNFKEISQRSEKVFNLDEYSSWIHPDDREKVQALRLHAQQSRQPLSADYRLQRKDGSYVWVQSRGQVLHDEASGQELIIGTLTDISERKAIEQNLRAAKDAANEANRAKSKLLSSITHEIKTPLTTILGIADILRYKLANVEHRTSLRRLISAAEHLNHLVDDILTLSKLESRALDVSIERVNPHRLIAETIDWFSEILETSETVIQCELLDSPPKLDIDPIRFKQVLTNLLSNAIKYSPNNSKVKVIEAQTEQVYTITVKDEGWGIPPLYRERLFESFNRFGREQTAVEGTGIGLAICRELMNLMGGEVSYQPQEKGSLFILSFPVR
ncbi:ATP-binding protein [Idiomarina sp.]|uniref:ATP-binding protein n=1 Tax=Idiomarina sp. TaxID=1874361 RepID=UPI0025C1D776|nr:ATP-binding protein [Idiomarina sp.]NQZ03441.1 PAS domain-containing protein [Idiomarina sp.]